MRKDYFKAEKFTLKTKDNHILKANFYDLDKEKCVLLLHQFSKNKESWTELISVLLRKHSVLSVDLRGHGESAGNYNDFEEKDFENMEQDVKSAINFLEEKGFQNKNISLIGSNIGANLAQNYASGNPYHKIVLLSPRKNHKGIELIVKDTRSLIVVSEEDKYSYETVKKLEKECESCKIIYLKNKGHGTSTLTDEVISSAHIFLTE